jgi:hypothetical protein
MRKWAYLKCYYKHILMYGAGTWTRTEEHISRPMSVQMKYLRSIDGKLKWERIQNKKIWNNLQINTLKGKVANNKVR